VAPRGCGRPVKQASGYRDNNGRGLRAHDANPALQAFHAVEIATFACGLFLACDESFTVLMTSATGFNIEKQLKE